MNDDRNRDALNPWNARNITGLTGLIGLAALLAWSHAPEEHGMSPEEIHQASLDEVEALGVGNGALLVDFVEPAEGEGGSEAAIAEAAANMALPGLHAELAGFYAESEHLYRVEGDPAALRRLEAQLADDPLVEGVEADVLYELPAQAISVYDGPLPGDGTGDDADAQRPDRPRYVPNDPMFPLQWHMEAIHAPEAWTNTRGEGAVIAVIDTGVAYKDLDWKGVKARAVPDLAGVEMVKGETFINDALPEGLDDHAHGTHVAGTVAQATNNGIGVAGVAHNAKIMPLKVLAGDGRGSVAGIANAIRYAADNGANVINMSLGGPIPSRVMGKAVEYAHDKGVVVVCAAGNEKRSRVSYPAAYAKSFAVAATDFEGQRTFYSNWGKALDISAPGGDTRVDKNRDGHPDGVLQNTIAIQDPEHNDYLWFMGTSMASPHVAGIAGLVVSEGVTNPAEVERIIQATAHHPNGKEWDKEYGAGIADAAKAVEMARQDYTPERWGFAAFLGLLGLAGIGGSSVGGSGRRRMLVAGGGFAAGLAVATGLIFPPLAYMGAGAFGVAAYGSAIFMSAALPLLATLLLLSFKDLRGLLTGLSLGYAALLTHAAVVLPTLITGVPGGPGWDRLWLAGNAVLALWLARRVSDK